MIKKTLHLLPVFLLTLAGIFSMLFYFSLIDVAFEAMIIVLVIQFFAYVFSVSYAPFDDIFDILCEAMSLVLHIVLFAGLNILMLSKIPYSFLILLIYLVSVIFYFVIFFVKLSAYSRMSADLKKNKEAENK